MNIILFSTICGLLAILIIYKQRKCWYFIWQLNGWRGLLQQPILWLLLIIYLEPKSVMSSIQRCHKYFQFPLAIIVFNRILLYVDDPETMESILTAPECLNKTFLQNGFYANKGLLHAKDEQWKIRRKQLNPAFSHNTLVSFFGVFNRVANELNVKISKDLQGYKTKFKSFEDLITRAVLQVSCLTTMGFETNFLQQDEKHIAQSYRFLMELTALRILKPWYQIDFIFRWLDKKSYEKSKRANKLVTDFVAKIVQQKHIEWQQQQQYNYTTKRQKLNFTTITTNSKFATATTYAEEVKDKVALNAYEEKHHNFVANRSTAANDAFKIIIKENSVLTDTNVNAVMEEEQPKKEMLQRQRIFIDQIFYLAQSGKLSLEDIMNESQSMVVVSFETVSSCIINALLCLAINHECQMKLRHEIKQILAMSKEKICNKNKTKMTTPITSIKDDKDTKAKAATTTTRTMKKENESSNKTTANRIDNDWDFETLTADCESDVVNNIKVSKDTSDIHGNTNTHAAAAVADNDDVDVDENVNNDCDVNVTMEHLLNMPYLDMIINESLRLLTTVPMNLRNVSCDFKLNVKQCDKCSVCKVKTNYSTNENNDSGVGDICGCSSSYHHEVVVPKDTMIALDTFSMQRNELYWGENALKFYPEHFAKRNQLHNQSEMKNKEFQGTSATSSASEATTRHSYAFIPFSKGLRTCIGYRYSIYLSKIVLIKLISSFEFSTNIQLQDLQCYEGVSLKFRNADKINFQIKPVN